MRLYHSPGSRSTRVLWVLEEIGAPYDLTIVSREERRSPEFRDRHPLGRVPVLELDDGRTLIESAAICLYLGDRFPEAGLAPAPDSPERPWLYQWTVFAMTELEPAAGGWMRADREGTDPGDHPANFIERAGLLEQALADRDWLLGDFSVVDAITARVVNMVFGRNLTGELPRLRAYTERALARPAAIRADALGRQPA
jgi:glutathione S-transferase